MYMLGTKKDERVYTAARILSVMDPDSTAYKVGSKLTIEVLEKSDGSGATAVVDAIMLAEGPRTMQEAIREFKALLKLYRSNGEVMTRWTMRFKLQVAKTGEALHAAEPDIPADGYLHSKLLGVLLLEGTNLDPPEIASLLATSGKTGAQGARIGNSYDLADLCEALCTQWSEEELLRRDKSVRQSRRSAAAHAADVYDLQLMTEQMAQTNLEESSEADQAYWAQEEQPYEVDYIEAAGEEDQGYEDEDAALGDDPQDYSGGGPEYVRTGRRRNCTYGRDGLLECCPHLRGGERAPGQDQDGEGLLSSRWRRHDARSPRRWWPWSWPRSIARSISEQTPSWPWSWSFPEVVGHDVQTTTAAAGEEALVAGRSSARRTVAWTTSGYGASSTSWLAYGSRAGRVPPLRQEGAPRDQLSHQGQFCLVRRTPEEGLRKLRRHVERQLPVLPTRCSF